jgi:hypothetical protein
MQFQLVVIALALTVLMALDVPTTAVAHPTHTSHPIHLFRRQDEDEEPYVDLVNQGQEVNGAGEPPVAASKSTTVSAAKGPSVKEMAAALEKKEKEAKESVIKERQQLQQRTTWRWRAAPRTSQPVKTRTTQPTKTPTTRPVKKDTSLKV